MSLILEPGESLQLIPPGCRLFRRGDRVVIMFQNENDAILFCEVLRALQVNPDLHVRATKKGENNAPTIES